MYGFLLFLFVVNTLILMIVILMQSSKSAGLSSTFGGVSGAASSTFGTRETVSFLHKLTIVLTTSFFVLAIIIGLISKAEFQRSNAPSNSVIIEKAAPEPMSGQEALEGSKLLLEDDQQNEQENIPVQTDNEENSDANSDTDNGLPLSE
ncbi:MAG: preprotein translocase subunit SecG [Candidatus Delongbacteria bacterium]